MAKRIKPIKCPQCGSTQATETKTDYYRCNSCQSEFFIDSDDININHRHTYDTPQLSAKHLKALKFLGLGIAVFFLMMMVISLLPSRTTYSPSAIQENKPYWGIEAIIPTADKEGEPIAVAVGDIVSGNYPNQTYKPTFGFFHAQTFKEIATVPIDIEKVGDVSYKKMDEGKTYIIINKNRLFLLDEKTLSINEVTPQSIGLAEFEKGFAGVELAVAYENTLKITNNLGQGYYYYPKLNKAVVYGNYKEIDQLIAQNPIAPQGVTKFVFTKKGVGFSEKMTDKFPELFKVKTQSQIGYPYRELMMRWNYNLSEQRVELETFQKESRIVEYKNFTPNRIYFVPEVFHYDDNEVLIHFKHELAESSPYFFQVLDAQTGEVKLSLQSHKNMHYVRDDFVAKTKDGYLITLRDIFLLNTKNGKLEKLELREKLTQR
ncbi:Conserved hypothetical protein [Capnocytophaga canimorsus Cc5]|uniref:Uncharacterized protein n=1 Tax=Capnocytophaga canimorsus (strain 5) TaxID=860228 RepID=F9YSX0_CAPCC|nr:hypothetical protein [Capnocytophaga canimorsus]AEK23965.1 Conserved hypothetical protein [Capnocytophaga canimorsus Cc5]